MKPYVHETNPVERQAAHTWDVRMCDMMISREKRSIFTTQTDGFEDKASQRLAYQYTFRTVECYIIVKYITSNA